ncbi:MAG: DUF4362 domain-containing protein [Butyricicoccus sp.]|nr:DUF4362 domain-containing protein [Butyricicoccus sp.]
MKYKILLLLIMLLLTGCHALPQPDQPSNSVQSNPGSDKGVNCGIVECSVGQEDPDGSEYFTAFAELSAAGRPCSVRVICKSIEGVSIDYDLSFDSTAFTCTMEVPSTPYSTQETKTSDWAKLTPVETYENTAFYRYWYLTGANYDVCTHLTELGKTSDTLLLFRETLSATQVQQVECGVYERPLGGDTDLSARDSFIDLAHTQGIPAHLRIISYTVEGDPIVTDVTYDGQSYTCTQDTTADRFGSQDVTTSHWPYLVLLPEDSSNICHSIWLSNTPNTADAENSFFLFEETDEHLLPSLR